MRIALLLLLAACEIQPAPKKQPAPVIENAGSAQPAPPPAPPPAAAEAAIADAGPRAPEASEPCIAVAAHVAEVFIQSATDPAQKAVYEQEREKMIRATSEACTKQAWPDDAQKCYLVTKTPAEIKACETKFPPQPAPVTPKPLVPEPRKPAEKKSPAGAGVRPARVEQGVPPNAAQP
ncbi:MAG TPA: hypothetical protein VLB44_17040 [Kofleriaceae bacterium]|nr:hypothetical protein [Kofleriaceae bacterium]